MNIGIEDIAKVVNEKLKEGLSTAQIEKEMKVGKDTLRKKLNRANYRYNKDLKQYELVSNTEVTLSVITQQNTDVLHKNNTSATQSVITQKVKSVTQEKIELTEEEINILKIITRNYKISNRSYELEGEIVTRSVRTYKNVLGQFASYCKENNLSQKDSIALALIDFMKV
ncbi:hypothetical protein [Romboutsia sp.]|uniref:hypothetical protein n=1 Tax=Romboutsia sp. TaxID=1965302 RepID=UPI003F331B43